MGKTNIDKAIEANAYLTELRGKRDRWLWRAWREDKMSHGAIAHSLGVSRQAVQQACARGAPQTDTLPPPSVPSTRQERGTEVAPRFRT